MSRLQITIAGRAFEVELIVPLSPRTQFTTNSRPIHDRSGILRKVALNDQRRVVSLSSEHHPSKVWLLY